MPKKIRIGVLFGGKSAEHEVSLQSARNVIDALDPEKYEVVAIGIDKQGRWHLSDSLQLLNPGAESPEVAIVPRRTSGALMAFGDNQEETLDVVFPVLHGPLGEDGTIQGLLRLANVPFVGSDVLGSAIGMDKDVMKRLLNQAGITTAPFKAFSRSQRASIDATAIIAELGLPLFVKPANMGSSLGIHKVKSAEEFDAAVNDAFSYDTKILIEGFVDGREIECAVLGNDEPAASVAGEIVLNDEFYAYDTKYVSDEGASLVIPAELPLDTAAEIQRLAVRVFEVCCAQGLARVDFFLRTDGTIVVNEINTLPGFTNHSMYPKLWEASSIPYAQLVDTLVDLAIKRHETLSSLTSDPAHRK